MRFLDIESWNRKEHFEFFNTFLDPYFSVTSKFDVTKAKDFSKKNKLSFFAVYLHACIQAINKVENLRYRIEKGKVVIYDVIHASATVLRPDKTFGFSFVNYNKDVFKFVSNYEEEKKRIINSSTLFPPVNSIDCIYCSALPWANFTGHKEPLSGAKESVPKLSFGKVENTNGVLEMSVAINVNHALVDGYHVGLFIEEFQKNLNAY